MGKAQRSSLILRIQIAIFFLSNINVRENKGYHRLQLGKSKKHATKKRDKIKTTVSTTQKKKKNYMGGRLSE